MSGDYLTVSKRKKLRIFFSARFKSICIELFGKFLAADFNFIIFFRSLGNCFKDCFAVFIPIGFKMLPKIFNAYNIVIGKIIHHLFAFFELCADMNMVIAPDLG